MFLSHGDFLFPLEAALYWLKHLFVWSFQTGALNLDGIIRMPGRLLYAEFFEIFGHAAHAYFFLATSLLIAFVAFYYFAKKFLGIEKRSVLITASLFFAINPIFLGNLAKTGLIVAVAMLPLALAFIYQAFTTRRLGYLLLLVFALNISLIHPFHFAVNALVAGVYLLYMMYTHRQWVRHSIWKIGVLAAAAILLHAYFLLPLASLGTLSKSTLSQEISQEQTDYSQLVDIANTGDIFTALSLSKTVLKDFEFYTAAYWPVYIAAVFALYLLLLGLYLYHERHITRGDKRRFGAFLLALAVLMVLSTATFFGIDTIIKFVIELPGGWMFRSPLKWQLYIPILLAALFVVVMRYSRTKTLHWLGVGGMVAIVVLANANLVRDIAAKLLTPRTFDTFAALAETDMEQKHLLWVNGEGCTGFAREHSAYMTELNQVLLSKNTQIKRIASSYADTVKLDDYDFLLGCELSPAEQQLITPQRFTEAAVFADGAFRLYKNPDATPHTYAFTSLFALDSIRTANQKAAFTEGVLGEAFHFVNEQEYTQHAIGLNNVFETIEPGSIEGDTITTTALPNNPGEQELLIRQRQPLHFTHDGTRLHFSPQPFEGSQALEASDEYARLNLHTEGNEMVTFTYKDSRFTYQNALPNASFEQGAWQQEVGDCNAYDDKPAIGMAVDNEDKTDGAASLKLTAERHIACTSPADTPVTPGGTYLLSFDYRSSHTREAGYDVSFNDELQTNKREIMASADTNWQKVSRLITVPEGASALSLTLYALPDEITGTGATVRYDNFRLIEVPAITKDFYMLNHTDDSSTRLPSELTYDIQNPTRTEVFIKNATAPFYLMFKDSYHAGWRLSLANPGAGVIGGLPWLETPGVPDDRHFKLNNVMNGWYVDPAELCKYKFGCTRNTDGSYDLHLVAEFTPQRWFAFGGLLSGLTLVGCVAYIVVDLRRRPGGGNS